MLLAKIRGHSGVELTAVNPVRDHESLVALTARQVVARMFLDKVAIRQVACR